MKKHITKVLLIVFVIIILSNSVFAVTTLFTENGFLTQIIFDSQGYVSRSITLSNCEYYLGGYDNYQKIKLSKDLINNYKGPWLYRSIKAAGVTKDEFIELWKVQETNDIVFSEDDRLSEHDIEVLFSDDIGLINRTFALPTSFVTSDGEDLYSEEQVFEKLSFEELQQLKDNGLLDYLENRYDAYQEYYDMRLQELIFENTQKQKNERKHNIESYQEQFDAHLTYLRNFITAVETGVAPQTGTPIVPLTITALLAASFLSLVMLTKRSGKIRSIQ